MRGSKRIMISLMIVAAFAVAGCMVFFAVHGTDFGADSEAASAGASTDSLGSVDTTDADDVDADESTADTNTADADADTDSADTETADTEENEDATETADDAAESETADEARESVTGGKIDVLEDDEVSADDSSDITVGDVSLPIVP